MTTPRTASRFVAPVALAVATASSFAHAQDTDACINASEKAVAQHKAQKLVNERALLAVCAASSCPEVVRSSCQQRLAQVNQSIPSIVFSAKDGAGHDVAAVKLAIDGVAYTDPRDGDAIVLDPGEHEFRFEAPGQAPVVKRFIMHQGEQNRREDILVGPAALPATTVAPTVPPPPDSAATTSALTAGERRSTHGNTQRAIGIVVGGVGVASLAAGAIFGGLSMAAHGSYENDCGGKIGAPAGFCNHQGVSGESDAATKGTLSTIFFLAGGVAAAAGAAVFFTAPRGDAMQVGVGPGAVVVKGRF
jgi:hypothetical protein